MIVDQLQGVPLDISAVLIMEMVRVSLSVTFIAGLLTAHQLFGFNPDSYYRDVLVLFAFIAGFGIILIGVVWLKLKEKR